MAGVDQQSSSNNVAQLFTWKWQEWDWFIQKFFRAIPHITNYQHFRFSATSPGTVFVRDIYSSQEVPIKVFKRRVTAASIRRANQPREFSPAGITTERKKYLYEHIL